MLKIQDVVAVLDVVSKQKVTATRLFPHQLELTAPQMCFEVPVAAPTDMTLNSTMQAGGEISCTHALCSSSLTQLTVCLWEQRLVILILTWSESQGFQEAVSSALVHAWSYDHMHMHMCMCDHMYSHRCMNVIAETDELGGSGPHDIYWKQSAWWLKS